MDLVLGIDQLKILLAEIADKPKHLFFRPVDIGVGADRWVLRGVDLADMYEDTIVFKS